MTGPASDDIGGHCPRCGADYRPGFDVCADCGILLVSGPGPAHEPSASPLSRPHIDIPDEEFEAALRELRGAPERFRMLATMPIGDALAAANDLWRHGIGAVFVPTDDPSVAVAAGPDAAEEDEDLPTGAPPGLEGLTPTGPFGRFVGRVSVPLVVLLVRVEDEHEARRIEARRVGVL